MSCQENFHIKVIENRILTILLIQRLALKNSGIYGGACTTVDVFKKNDRIGENHKRINDLRHLKMIELV